MISKVFSPDINWRHLWLDYRSEFFFGAVLGVLVVLSMWWGRFIPDEVYDNILTPIFNTCTVALSFGGAWMLFHHSEGIKARRLFAVALLVWGICDLIYLVGWAVAPNRVMDMAAYELTTYELILGNILGWVLLLYPTEALRPGWMNWKRAFMQLLPLAALMAFDYIMPFNLWPVIALYPYILLVMLFRHMHVYRKWCEDNFSRLNDIDVRWIIRYSIMLFIVGLNYVWMCSTHYHTRGFTQQWFVVIMFIYATEQILFRKDPWEELLKEDGKFDNASSSDEASPANRQLFEQWMDEKKPYLNPDFQLNDLRTVLPMNRTYLSQFVNSEYGCSFYMLVNRYRIAEAKRLMTEQPDLKIQDIADRCGFSSRRVFSQIFTRETGTTPTEWK